MHRSFSRARLLPAAVVIAAPLVLIGCSLTATMVPVEGPLSQLRPVPVFNVRVDGIMGNTGKISFAMQDGETCKGRWSSAAGAGVSVAAGSLVSQYGSAYLTGYSVSTGSGRNPGQALIVCTKGRTIQVDFVTGAGTAHGFGIAKDNESNVYRLVF